MYMYYQRNQMNKQAKGVFLKSHFPKFSVAEQNKTTIKFRK